MGWMVRLGESHVGRRLVLVFAPSAGRRREIVHEQAGGPGHRRVCARCGATVDDDSSTCPVDGAPVVEVTVREATTARDAGPAAWSSGTERPDDRGD